MTDMFGRLDILQLYNSAVEETDNPEDLVRNLHEHIESQRRSNTDEAIGLLGVVSVWRTAHFLVRCKYAIISRPVRH